MLGLLLLTAEGPYHLYGMPCYVTIRRRNTGYEIDWTEAGDGAGVLASARERCDRAGLLCFLEDLSADGRPVKHLDGR